MSLENNSDDTGDKHPEIKYEVHDEQEKKEDDDLSEEYKGNLEIKLLEAYPGVHQGLKDSLVSIVNHYYDLHAKSQENIGRKKGEG